MRKVLVIVEQGSGILEDTAREAATAAGELTDVEVAAAVLGHGISDLATELARWFPRVHVFDDPRLEWPDGDLAARVLAPLVREQDAWLTLIPHTNRGLELAPLLAARVDAPLLADCQSLEEKDGRLHAVRALFGGRLQARVSAEPGAHGLMATLRPGSHAVSGVPLGATGKVSSCEFPTDAQPRRRHLEIVAPEAGDVDISQAELLVGVGRGIEDAENLPLVTSLANALGAEIAATRPVVDKQWLARSRQVGTSGTTVKPRLYLALGVSGSFQHLGGIKGDPFLVAINKDPKAPIFDVADVGIVGDLLDLVPVLETKIRERKG